MNVRDLIAAQLATGAKTRVELVMALRSAGDYVEEVAQRLVGSALMGLVKAGQVRMSPLDARFRLAKEAKKA